MAVRIASIDLDGVQAIVTDEGRRWVEQHIPGRAGSLFQQLGRSAVRIQLEGLLLGDGALDKLEALRAAQAEAKAVPFTADVTAGMDFTDVLIDALHVRQVAGYRSRFWFRLLVREHVEEPPAPGVAGAAVDAGVQADAAAWAGEAVDAASAMQDVTALPALLEANPGVLEHLSTGDLVGALSEAGPGLSGGTLDGILSATGLDAAAVGEITQRLKQVQLSDVVAAYDALKDPSKLPGLLSTPGMLDRLGVGDLGRSLARRADALTGGQFSAVLQSIGNVDPQKVVGLLHELRNADSLGDFVEKLASDGVDLVKDLTGVDLGDAAALVKGIAGAADFIRKLQKAGADAGRLAGALRGFDPLAPVRALSGQDPGDAGTLGDIVQETGQFLTDMNALLGTQTVKEALALARQVGAEAQLNAAVDSIAGVLTEVDGLLEGTREPLRQLEALRGLLLLTASLVSGVDRLARASGEELAALGLGEAGDSNKPLGQALGMGREVLTGGAAVLEAAPQVEQVDALRAGVADVRTRLLGYKVTAAGGTP